MRSFLKNYGVQLASLVVLVFLLFLMSSPDSPEQEVFTDPKTTETTEETAVTEPPMTTTEVVETVPETTYVPETTVMETTVPETVPEETTIPETEPETEPEEVTPRSDNHLGRFVLTAYCPCSKCCGIYASNRPKDENGNDIVYTASGERAKSDYTIAVDPSVIPYGTEVIINNHVYRAQDCGGAVDGNHIDIYFATHEEACAFGKQYAEVYLKG